MNSRLRNNPARFSARPSTCSNLLLVAQVVLSVTCVVLVATSALAAAPSITVPAYPTDMDVTPADEEAAKQGYARIQEAFAKEDFAGALEHADTVFAAVPNASTALIRAAILNKTDAHKEAFLTYLVATSFSPTAKEKSAITNGLASHGRAARPRLGGLLVEGAPDGAQCEADGVTWPCSVRVAASSGTVRVAVSAAGFEPKTVKARVRVGKIRTAKVKLKAAPVAAGDGATGDGATGDGATGDGATGDGATGDGATGDGATGDGATGDGATGDGATGDGATGDGSVDWGKYKPPSRSANVGAWLLVGVGAGSLIGGGVMHGFAFGAKSDADALALPDDAVDDADRRRRYDSARDTAESNETTALILYGVGAAALAGGIIWLASDTDSSASSVHVAPVLGPTGGGLAAVGRF